jgi:hypothetical protein
MIAATILPPLLACGWYAAMPVVDAICRTELEDWWPLLTQAASLAGLAAIVVIAVAPCHRSGTAKS